MGFVSWAGDKVPVFTGTDWGVAGGLASGLPSWGLVHSRSGGRRRCTGPAEVVEVGGEDFDAVLVRQRVDGAEEGVEGAVFLDEFEGALGVGDGGLDLAAVVDEAWVGLEAFEVGGAVVGDAGDVEAVEGFLEAGPLVVDDAPTEAGAEDSLGEFLKVAVT